MNDKDPERTFIDVYRKKVHLKCHDTFADNYTEALYTPTKITITAYSAGQKSRRTMTATYIKDEVDSSSWMLMTGNHITLQSPRIDLNP